MKARGRSGSFRRLAHHPLSEIRHRGVVYGEGPLWEEIRTIRFHDLVQSSRADTQLHPSYFNGPDGRERGSVTREVRIRAPATRSILTLGPLIRKSPG